MALKFNNTNVSALKLGANNVETGKFGSTTVFSSSSGNWHTIYSGGMELQEDAQNEVIVGANANATQFRVSVTWWLYDISTHEVEEGETQTITFNRNDVGNIESPVSDYQYGIAQFAFFLLNSNIVYTCDVFSEGAAFIQFATLDLLEEFY